MLPRDLKRKLKKFRKDYKEFRKISVINNSPRTGKNSIVIGIPTYEREKLLKRLLTQLDGAAKNYDVTIIVLDDGSNKMVKLNDVEFHNVNDLCLYRSTRNNGKQGYWKTVSFIFDKMSEIQADYYYYLGDDLEVRDDFFNRSTNIWDAIADPKKISLNLLNDGRDECWTKFKRELKKMGDYNIFLSQWLDMIIMFDHKLLEHPIDPINKERWKRDPLLSSGVGSQLSIRLKGDGFNMYQVANSLVYHSDHNSVMNPHCRKNNPLCSIL